MLVSRLRGVAEEDLKGKNARFVNFQDAAELYAIHDKVAAF